MHNQLTRTFVYLLLIPQEIAAQAWKRRLNTGKIYNYCVYIHML